jgi:hypothetical protein
MPIKQHVSAAVLMLLLLLLLLLRLLLLGEKVRRGEIKVTGQRRLHFAFCRER